MTSKVFNAYFFSGLGADQRAFEKIELPSNYKIRHIDWIPPLPKEHLKDYCLRIGGSIDIGAPFILIGLSFGGIIVTELAKVLKPERVIIISSISVRSEMPWYYRLAGKLRVHRLISIRFLKSANIFTFWAFGTKKTAERELLKKILRDTDSGFLEWAINIVLTWNTNSRPGGLIHIHGTNDKILPCRFVKCDIKVEGGGHLMVLNRYGEINEILSGVLR